MCIEPRDVFCEFLRLHPRQRSDKRQEVLMCQRFYLGGKLHVESINRKKFMLKRRRRRQEALCETKRVDEREEGVTDDWSDVVAHKKSFCWILIIYSSLVKPIFRMKRSLSPHLSIFLQKPLDMEICQRKLIFDKIFFWCFIISRGLKINIRMFLILNWKVITLMVE